MQLSTTISTFFIFLYIPSALSNPAPAVSTVTVSASAASAPTDAAYTNSTTFLTTILTAHNFYRTEHNASALTWNSTSATFAQNWAAQCHFSHTGGPTGENIAAGYANVTAAVDGWGGERTAYDFGKPTGFSEKTGHFTQLVWKNTRSVGCGRFWCGGVNKTPGYYIVCEYYPIGNVDGAKKQYYKDNVQKQIKGKASDTVETGITSGAGSYKDGDDGKCKNYYLL